jgi:hypothetical protein
MSSSGLWWADDDDDDDDKIFGKRDKTYILSISHQTIHLGLCTTLISKALAPI